MFDFNEFATTRNKRSELETSKIVDQPLESSSEHKDSRFCINQLSLKPGDQLSTRRHLHHSRHWIVVVGTADVLVGERLMTLSESNSVDVQIGEYYSLKNSGLIPLELVEVRMGCYLDDDDVEVLKVSAPKDQEFQI